MFPPAIPVFPLPNVVLFPTVFLPLHVFEPRYREMVADALEGDRIIGMTLLKPGWEEDYTGRPAIYRVGCAGLISHVDELADGRYNIVLRGFGRFRVDDEEPGRAYRVARVTWLADPDAEAERDELQQERHRLESLLVPLVEGSRPQLPTTLPDDHLVNALAQYLDLEPVERQALLEIDGVLARCRALVDLVEMQQLVARTAGRPPTGRH
jgi:hypothetical protein